MHQGQPSTSSPPSDIKLHELAPKQALPPNSSVPHRASAPPLPGVTKPEHHTDSTALRPTAKPLWKYCCCVVRAGRAACRADVFNNTPHATQEHEGQRGHTRCPTAPQLPAKPTLSNSSEPAREAAAALLTRKSSKIRAERNAGGHGTHRPAVPASAARIQTAVSAKEANVCPCLTVAASRLASAGQRTARGGAAPQRVNTARGRPAPQRVLCGRGNRREKGEPPTRRHGRPRPAGRAEQGRAEQGRAAPPRGRRAASAAGNPRAREAGCRHPLRSLPGTGGAEERPSPRRWRHRLPSLRPARVTEAAGSPRPAPPRPAPPAAPPRAGITAPSSPTSAAPLRGFPSAKWSLGRPRARNATACVAGTPVRFPVPATPLPRSRFGIPSPSRAAPYLGDRRTPALKQTATKGTVWNEPRRSRVWIMHANKFSSQSAPVASPTSPTRRCRAPSGAVRALLPGQQPRCALGRSGSACQERTARNYVAVKERKRLCVLVCVQNGPEASPRESEKTLT